jgi:hypothetical protein
MAKRNPLLNRQVKNIKTIDLPKSAGILDDYAVRKNIASKEGTIEHTPTEDNHIVNKKYVDDKISGIEIDLDLDDLEDVDASSPNDYDFLRYNSGTWEPYGFSFDFDEASNYSSETSFDKSSDTLSDFIDYVCTALEEIKSKLEES